MRDQNSLDPIGDVCVQTVEAVFVWLAPILEVQVAGRVIRTTDEHPFWVVDRGWQPARKLSAGDRLIGHDNQQVVVEKVTETGNWERVYNLRVADHHTYFLGCDEWGFSVWAHNAYTIRRLEGGGWTLVDEEGKIAAIAEGKAFKNPTEVQNFAKKNAIEGAVIDSKAAPIAPVVQAAPAVSLETQIDLARNAKVQPGDVRGALPNATGQPGHALPKHDFSNEMVADIINTAEMKFVGINKNNRPVTIFYKDGNVVITQADDVTRVITAYGKDGVQKLPGGKVVPGEPVKPLQWQLNPNYWTLK